MVATAPTTTSTVSSSSVMSREGDKSDFLFICDSGFDAIVGVVVACREVVVIVACGESNWRGNVDGGTTGVIEVIMVVEMVALMAAVVKL
ncbi:conserved hypothetical protein [Ricinus communis]|uniref:Uncharacterized protein n=1 Tax=Ricinus communis TaxID=3988 RepID=B9S884_RICCO|nr:conserved hypothetical protein [Ricinus communis]